MVTYEQMQSIESFKLWPFKASEGDYLVQRGYLVNGDALTGEAKPAADISGEKFLGLSEQDFTQSTVAHVDGTIEVTPKGSGSVFRIECVSAFDGTNQGDEVFVASSTTVALAADVTNGISVGFIRAVSEKDSRFAWVQI